MKVEIRKDGSPRWLLDSGWRVDPNDSLSFTAPNLAIYDRCGTVLHSRSTPEKLVLLCDIFRPDEWVAYRACFPK